MAKAKLVTPWCMLRIRTYLTSGSLDNYVRNDRCEATNAAWERASITAIIWSARSDAMFDLRFLHTLGCIHLVLCQTVNHSNVMGSSYANALLSPRPTLVAFVWCILYHVHHNKRDNTALPAARKEVGGTVWPGTCQIDITLRLPHLSSFTGTDRRTCYVVLCSMADLRQYLL